MSVYLSYLADELTEIEERLMEADLAPYSTALRRAIARAFELTCEAQRLQRSGAAAHIDQTGQANQTDQAESLKFLSPKAA